ncbi:hypothetical protein V144x_00260 [Gimesia aquarii]|uniref:Uncharacterized protein n=1 Tax=Gimesia aquarii TaxID=2527964 RepID=A0A517VNK4_9PLAN|nr:hypothetical protein V144x_00260 [Gimesia aquarii]
MIIVGFDHGFLPENSRNCFKNPSKIGIEAHFFRDARHESNK